ncbi:hypothetical protein VNO78_27896 [Psophocarpus tetragonolobus]|uniref:Uncharacterized protein n=1 Tax=Psophocarpus tetragonolobus TaxID=3891 RepID=A0AAN9XAK8_PSOTE
MNVCSWVSVWLGRGLFTTAGMCFRVAILLGSGFRMSVLCSWCIFCVSANVLCFGAGPVVLAAFCWILQQVVDAFVKHGLGLDDLFVFGWVLAFTSLKDVRVYTTLTAQMGAKLALFAVLLGGKLPFAVFAAYGTMGGVFVLFLPETSNNLFMIHSLDWKQE